VHAAIFEQGKVKGGAGEGEFQHHLVNAAPVSVLRLNLKHCSGAEQNMARPLELTVYIEDERKNKQ
jgi:hypothetical protein